MTIDKEAHFLWYFINIFPLCEMLNVTSFFQRESYKYRLLCHCKIPCCPYLSLHFTIKHRIKRCYKSQIIIKLNDNGRSNVLAVTLIIRIWCLVYFKDTKSPTEASPSANKCTAIANGQITDRGKSFTCNTNYKPAFKNGMDAILYTRYSCTCNKTSGRLQCMGTEVECTPSMYISLILFSFSLPIINLPNRIATHLYTYF